MIEEVIKQLQSLDIDSKTKLNQVKDLIMCYSVQEVSVFNCYRTLKHLELEISELQNELPAEVLELSKKVIRIIATELDIINVRMRIAQNMNDIGENNCSDLRLNWTDSKTDMVELIYSIKNSIGEGKVSIKKITTCFEYFFQIKLGNVYDILSDISIRKINRTRYNDKITANFQELLAQMDS